MLLYGQPARGLALNSSCHSLWQVAQSIDSQKWIYTISNEQCAKNIIYR